MFSQRGAMQRQELGTADRCCSVGVDWAAEQLTLLHSAQVAARGRGSTEAADGLTVRDTGLDGQPLGGLSYSDALPLRMCPGGMMSLVYASIVLSVLGKRPEPWN